MFFVLLPVVRIAGRPAVLLDVAAREFTFFGFTFYPTDTFLLLLVGIAILVSVALFTALLGRVWCGWGCPQTVYLEFFYRPVERLVEGPEHVRARRDAGPWTGQGVAQGGQVGHLRRRCRPCSRTPSRPTSSAWDRLSRG